MTIQSDSDINSYLDGLGKSGSSGPFGGMGVMVSMRCALSSPKYWGLSCDHDIYRMRDGNYGTPTWVPGLLPYGEGKPGADHLATDESDFWGVSSVYRAGLLEFFCLYYIEYDSQAMLDVMVVGQWNAGTGEVGVAVDVREGHSKYWWANPEDPNNLDGKWIPKTNDIMNDHLDSGGNKYQTYHSYKGAPVWPLMTDPKYVHFKGGRDSEHTLQVSSEASFVPNILHQGRADIPYIRVEVSEV